eukprot:COSAG01_NODE_12222_length_1777_cov_5.624553_2_plen_56_part_00
MPKTEVLQVQKQARLSAKTSAEAESAVKDSERGCRFVTPLCDGLSSLNRRTRVKA